jgi:hypothetical protein
VQVVCPREKRKDHVCEEVNQLNPRCARAPRAVAMRRD